MRTAGPGTPDYSQLPVTKKLTGAAIRGRKVVVVGDVRTDPRYVSAFGSTLSEIIIPVLDGKIGAVVGTIDVESDQANGFSLEDQKMLEECARRRQGCGLVNVVVAVVVRRPRFRDQAESVPRERRTFQPS